jgi:uncharacterized protein
MKQIFSCIVGSQAYGTNLPTSDTDIKGVYMEKLDNILGLNTYTEQLNVNKDNVSYELGRFIGLLATANPTVLELLYSPEDMVSFKDPIFDMLIANRDRFLTKKCRMSFGGYAVAQIKKARGLDKKMNWEKSSTERKTVLDFCYAYDTKTGRSTPIREWLKENELEQQFCGLSSIPHMKDCYNLYYDHVVHMMETNNPRTEKNKEQYLFKFQGIVRDEETANDVCLSEIPKYYDNLECMMIFNKDGYSSHCKKYNEYQEWLKNRNTQRYVDIEGHGQQIDGKNLMHCRRLLNMAIEIPKLKTLQVRRPDAKELLEIRQGKVDLDSIITKAEADIVLLDKLYEESDLPNDVDMDFCNHLLLEMRNRVYFDSGRQLTTFDRDGY